MTPETFTRFLEVARRRRWTQSIARRAALGLAIGSGIGLALSAVCLAAQLGRTELWVGVVVVLGGMVGLVTGVAARPSLPDTALAVDRRGRLKDRVHSALQFSADPSPDVYRLLQIRDATRALEDQVVSGLFPWRWPREGTWAAVGMILAVVTGVLVPEPELAEATPTGPPEVVVAEAKALGKDIEQLEAMSETLESEEMRDLIAKLREMLHGLESDTRSGEDAVVQLARMTAEIEAAAEQFDPMLLEQQLQEMSQGMKPLNGFETAAAMLEQKKYDRAAESLEKLGKRIGQESEQMPSSGGLADLRMGQLSQQAGAAGLTELSQSLKSLQKAIRGGSRKACQTALNRVAKSIGKYGRRVKVGRAMRGLQSRVNQCKTGLAGLCKGCLNGDKCEGGQCKGTKIGLPSLAMTQSDKPSDSAGSAAAMNLFDKATGLDGERTEEQVTSHSPGQGPSEVEAQITHDGRQQAARKYREVYSKYVKLSDAVMTEEAIPLAHRQIIKRYFELIHPSRVEAEQQLGDVVEITEQPKPGTSEDPSQ